jgi:hypothetical protein
MGGIIPSQVGSARPIAVSMAFAILLPHPRLNRRAIFTKSGKPDQNPVHLELSCILGTANCSRGPSLSGKKKTEFAQTPQVSGKAGRILLTNSSLDILQKQVYDLIGGLWRKMLPIVKTVKIEGNNRFVA